MIVDVGSRVAPPWLGALLLVVAACGKSDAPSGRKEAAGADPAAAGAKVGKEGTPPEGGTPAPPVAKACPDGTATIPGGTFTSARGGEVTVASFCLEVTEVTVAAYRACVEAGACAAPDLTYDGCNWDEPGTDGHAVNCVPAAQAKAYCAWAGKRLPTAPELEWAQRGGDAGTRYPWGDAADAARLCPERANADGDKGEPGTCVAGGCATSASPHGVHDLAGSVSEWATAPDGAIWNCGGMTDCSRGTTYTLEAQHVAGWCSTTGQPDVGYSGVGVRCAASR